MFHISTQKPEDGPAALSPLRDDAAMAALSRFCIVDEWSANLDNAMLHIGPDACAFHGLDPAVGHFGILEFVRCYEPAAAAEIVNVFERAAAQGLPFHYGAEIRSDDNTKAIVHCFGQHGDMADPAAASFSGVFVMARQRFQRC